MILLFGGTTEGRDVARVLDAEGRAYLYSTQGRTDFVPPPPSSERHGALTLEEMIALGRQRRIRLLLDASHPFASALHQSVADAAETLAIPAIRFERPGLPRMREPGVRYLPDFQEVLAALQELRVRRLLALTGVRSLPHLEPYWRASRAHRLWIRILPRTESIEQALALGLPRESLLPGGPAGTTGEHIDLIRRFAADALLTKESGVPGALPQKLEAARACGIPALVVSRPALPGGVRVVETAEALLRAVRECLA